MLAERKWLLECRATLCIRHAPHCNPHLLAEMLCAAQQCSSGSTKICTGKQPSRACLQVHTKQFAGRGEQPYFSAMPSATLRSMSFFLRPCSAGAMSSRVSAAVPTTPVVMLRTNDPKRLLVPLALLSLAPPASAASSSSSSANHK